MTRDGTTSALRAGPRTEPLGGARGGGTAAQLWARLARAPAAWLGLLVAASTLVRGAVGAHVPAPWILPDEIAYSELARSIAAGHRPAIRGVPVLGWGEVYPTLVAPAWALLDNPVHAYHAALAINALVMSSAALPAYLLARLFVSRRSSFLVALMTVLVPSMSYTGVVMTENACYPVFLLGVYLMARALRRPTAGAQALAFLGLALLAFTRIQGVALVGAYVCALALYAATLPSARGAYLRRLTPSLAVAVVAALGPVLVSAAAGDGAFGWLGPRSGTFAIIRLSEVPEWFVYLAGGLVLYVAVVPAAATVFVLVRGLSRRADERLRLYAAVVIASFLAVLASVALVSASVDVDGTENLNERYVFYLVPLLFLGLALWIDEGLPRRAPPAWAVLLGCCLVAVVVPIDRLHYNANFQSPGLLPWMGSSLSGPVLPLALAAFVLGCGAIWLTCRPDRAGRLWLLAGTWMSFVGLLALGAGAVAASDSASHSFSDRGEAWVDHAVPEGAEVAVVLDQRGLSRTRPDPVGFRVMVAEFFNFTVGDVYRVGPRTYYEGVLPTVPVRVGADGALLDRSGAPLDATYVLAPCYLPIAGDVVARGARGKLTLFRVAGAARLTGSSTCSTTGA